jgi:hypothetical protein
MKQKQILNVDSNTKTIKGEKLGVLTGILYLAPAASAGRENVCPMAKLAQCEEGCLNLAGRGIMWSVQEARIAKTRRFFDDRPAFIADLIFSIQFVVRKAHKMGMVPMIRLNGTSDIAWENIPVQFEGRSYENLMVLFPTVQFYDYTKLPTRKVPANYDLTFSYSGVAGYAGIVRKAVARGLRMAVVFRNKLVADGAISNGFMGWAGVSGDETDVRPYDAQGVIVALYAKGPAKKDVSGFVVD